jgi:predicted phage tail protein
MKVVKVYGALRKKLGQCRFEFEADTPAQALKALIVNFPGLDKWLVEQEAAGTGFRISIGKEKLTEDDPTPLVLPWSEREVFSITPVIVGAGRTVAQIGIGIGLVALAFAGGAGFFGAAFAKNIGLFAAMKGVGASLVLGGVAQMISPQPQMSNLERGKEAARLESFSFSGIVNTSQQGLPVPIIYGRAFVGSAVLSSGLDVAQLK